MEAALQPPNWVTMCPPGAGTVSPVLLVPTAAQPHAVLPSPLPGLPAKTHPLKQNIPRASAGCQPLFPAQIWPVAPPHLQLSRVRTALTLTDLDQHPRYLPPPDIFQFPRSITSPSSALVLFSRCGPRWSPSLFRCIFYPSVLKM